MSWTDYSQNVRIRELQEDLSSAHSQMARDRNRLRSELGRVRGSLEQRIDRVSATLDAFIELSDVRATLAMFDDAAIARHRTLQMLDGAVPPTLDLKDVPGYWLVPAARGLHALLRDDLSRARLRFDEAAAVDHERARAFAALTGALTRAEHARTLGEGVSADLLPHLPEPGVRLTRGQRALWILTADGSFGDGAREHLLLSTLRRWSAEGVEVPPVEDWSLPDAPSTRRGRRTADAAPQRQAALALAHLREDGLVPEHYHLRALGRLLEDVGAGDPPARRGEPAELMRRHTGDGKPFGVGLMPIGLGKRVAHTRMPLPGPGHARPGRKRLRTG